MSKQSRKVVKTLSPVFTAALLMVVLVPFAAFGASMLAGLVALSGGMAVTLVLAMVFLLIQNGDLALTQQSD